MRFNVSEITDIIRDRRTVVPENFSDRKVHRELVEMMIGNAVWAPTHGKTQPWRFTVFQDNSLVRLGNKLAELYKSETPEEIFSLSKFEKLNNRPAMASVVIAVHMERQAEERIPEVEEVEAVACGVQNLLLTATAYGIGSFWSSPKLIYGQGFSEFLNIGPKDQCLGLIYLGYPKGEWPKGQRKPIEYVTQWLSE
ncbi:MAG: nitroreductase [Luteibaculaceae bacterium]|jgi:nitroreductase